MHKKWILPFLLLLISIAVYIGFDLLYLNPPNTALKIDSIKISDELYDEKLKELDDITLTNQYFVETVVLSKIAIEIGLDKTLSMNDDHIPFSKRVSLVEDLKAYYKALREVAESEVKELYDTRYPAYFEYVAIESDKPIAEFFDKDLSSLKTSKGTIEDLHDLNIVNVAVNKWYELSKKDSFNRYIFISKELPREVIYEDVKLEIETELRESFSKITIENLLPQYTLKHTIYYYREASDN